MSNNRLPDKVANKNNNGGALSELEKVIYGFDKERTKQTPHINLKYIQTNFECFSDWTSDELKDFSGFINKLSESNWDRIFSSGGSVQNKSGFGSGL